MSTYNVRQCLASNHLLFQDQTILLLPIQIIDYFCSNVRFYYGLCQTFTETEEITLNLLPAWGHVSTQQ